MLSKLVEQASDRHLLYGIVEDDVTAASAGVRNLKAPFIHLCAGLSICAQVQAAYQQARTGAQGEQRPSGPFLRHSCASDCSKMIPVLSHDDVTDLSTQNGLGVAARPGSRIEGAVHVMHAVLGSLGATRFCEKCTSGDRVRRCYR